MSETERQEYLLGDDEPEQVITSTAAVTEREHGQIRTWQVEEQPEDLLSDGIFSDGGEADRRGSRSPVLSSEPGYLAPTVRQVG